MLRWYCFPTTRNVALRTHLLFTPIWQPTTLTAVSSSCRHSRVLWRRPIPYTATAELIIATESTSTCTTARFTGGRSTTVLAHSPDHISLRCATRYRKVAGRGRYRVAAHAMIGKFGVAYLLVRGRGRGILVAGGGYAGNGADCRSQRSLRLPAIGWRRVQFGRKESGR